MADLLTLNCPTCGGNLQVTNDVERFVCTHCGNAHIVDPGVRVESLAGELDQMRLTMDIRQAEDSLAVLRKRKLALEEVTTQQAFDPIWWKIIGVVLPVGVVVYGLYEGQNLVVTLGLAAFLSGVLWLVNRIFPVPVPNKSEQAELRRLNDRIKSGDRTLNFLKQELRRVTDGQRAVKND